MIDPGLTVVDQKAGSTHIHPAQLILTHKQMLGDGAQIAGRLKLQPGKARSLVRPRTLNLGREKNQQNKSGG